MVATAAAVAARVLGAVVGAVGAVATEARAGRVVACRTHPGLDAIILRRLVDPAVRVAAGAVLAILRVVTPVVWCGVVWCGVVWCGVVSHVVWCHTWIVSTTVAAVPLTLASGS